MHTRSPVPRYILGGEAQPSEAPGGDISRVTVVNMSTQGCRIEGRGVPAAGQQCELVIEWHGKKFRCETQVRWKKSERQAGLEFLSMDEAKFPFLRELFPTLRLEPFRPPRAKRTPAATKPVHRREKSR